MPKIQPDTTGTYAVVCDARKTQDQRCVEYRADAGSIMIDAAKGYCSSTPQPPRCPTQGATGRCEAKGVITLYYEATDMSGARFVCESSAGSWSQP